MLQPQVLEKVKPVGEVSLLVLMQGLSIIVPWQFTSLFTAWNCLSYTTRGAFLTKSNLNMYLLHHSADEVIQITSQELWDTIIKKTKGLRFTWLSISLKYNDLLFFFFFKQTQPVSCLGSKAKLTKVHQECQQILLTINHPHTSLTTNRELIMLIVGYLAAAPSINKCTKYSYSGCNTHTHTPTDTWSWQCCGFCCGCWWQIRSSFLYSKDWNQASTYRFLLHLIHQRIIYHD